MQFDFLVLICMFLFRAQRPGSFLCFFNILNLVASNMTFVLVLCTTFYYYANHIVLYIKPKKKCACIMQCQWPCLFCTACNPNEASIDNGRVATTGRVYGVGYVIPVTCDAGHVTFPEQDAGLTCGDGGTWLPTARCVRSCKYSDEKLIFPTKGGGIESWRCPSGCLSIFMFVGMYLGVRPSVHHYFLWAICRWLQQMVVMFQCGDV